jgi:hypothetical protein
MTATKSLLALALAGGLLGCTASGPHLGADGSFHPDATAGIAGYTGQGDGGEGSPSPTIAFHADTGPQRLTRQVRPRDPHCVPADGITADRSEIKPAGISRRPLLLPSQHLPWRSKIDCRIDTRPRLCGCQLVAVQSSTLFKGYANGLHVMFTWK